MLRPSTVPMNWICSDWLQERWEEDSVEAIIISPDKWTRTLSTDFDPMDCGTCQECRQQFV